MKYFQHLGTMRHDPKLKRVFDRYGIEGYGLYCLIVESITQSLEDCSPLPTLEETSEDIARFYKSDTAKVEEIIQYMCKQRLLSIESSGEISCHKIYKFLYPSATRSEKIKFLIKSYKDYVKEQKKIGKGINPSWLDLYEHVYAMSDTVSDKSQTVYARRDQTNLDDYKQEKLNLDQKECDFVIWFNHYPRKGDKRETMRLYLANQSMPDLEEHMALVSDWNSTEAWQKDNRAYIPNSISWLRSEKWKERPPTDPNIPNRHERFSTSPDPGEKKSMTYEEYIEADKGLDDLHQNVPWVPAKS